MVIPREPILEKTKMGLRRDYTPTPQSVTKAYLLGVLHDSTKRKNTYRIATKSHKYAELLKIGIRYLGRKAWVYKEGKQRSVWIVEFTQTLLTRVSITSRLDKIEYLRGYFDAEGGISKQAGVRYYIYFAQKNYQDLCEVRDYLLELNIACGVIHNPSRRVDPDYWRFYVRVQSYERFAQVIGSNHPVKYRYLRMKR